MTSLDIEARLEIVRTVIKFLTEKLLVYRAQEAQLLYELNRARRLEREELQNVTRP